MASSKDFVQYVCAQIAQAGDIRNRSMFGEYGVYCDEKLVALICDNQLLVKITPPGQKLLPRCDTAYPYEGSKTLYFLITDVEDSALLSRLVRETCDALPAPKPKKKRA